MSDSPPPATAEKSSDLDNPPRPSYIIGIGASAGGLEALVQFFSVMPPDSGYAFVVVQHLSPDFKSVMDELLARHTKMPIRLVEDRVEIEANTIYLIPPKKEMALRDGRLLLTDKDPSLSLSLPIDAFFRSMAEDCGDRAVAIVLSGTGSDGSRGIVDVHEAGGLIIAQDDESAKFNGMPHAALETGLVDYTLSPDKIPEAILRYTGSPLAGDSDAGPIPKDSDRYAAIFHRLRVAFKTDFSYYKSTTVNRRVERRMTHHNTNSLAGYVAILDKEPKELSILYNDLLIGVTRFFRDPEAFNKLEEKVLPELVASKQDGEQIRIWIPACATGEEAYSIAMLASEELARSDKSLELKIFATDLNPGHVSAAAAGTYSRDSLENVSSERIKRYFKYAGEQYQIDADLRRLIVFAEQNLLKDPPFTNIDLISCRNFLIYIQPIAQRKVLSMFHFSLSVGGTLFLGPSESLGDIGNEFDTVNRQWNFFKKRKEVRLSPIMALPPYGGSSGNALSSRAPRPIRQSPNRYLRGVSERELEQAYEELLGIHMPPSLLISSDKELVHVFGDGSKYIKRPAGRATLDVLKLVTGNLRLALSTALNRVASEKKVVTMKSIPMEGEDGGKGFLDLTVRPMREHGLVIAQFTEQGGSLLGEHSDSPSPFDVGEETFIRIRQLEKELQFSRENLQSTVEELETSNEELQATNEELLASNEELQSTNEELQSVNEELFTVNSEYERKNKELSLLNSDIDNMLKSTEIGTIFVDHDLCIRKFTPAIAENFNLLPMDIGRPFNHITYNILGVDDIADQVRKVIQTREPLIKEVYDRSNRWQLMRIFPYLNVNNEATGAVLTLVDISPIKEVEADLKHKAHSLENTKDDLEKFAYSVSHDLQEPLRAVEAYIDLVAKRLEGQDEEIREYMELAGKSARDIKEMLNDLLVYTRVDSRVQPFKPVALSEIIDAAVQNRQSLIDETRTVVNREGQSLKLFCDSSQMIALFTQLIGNALTFRRADKPVLSIKSKAAGGFASIEIKDNGQGMGASEQKRAFDLFFNRKSGGGGAADSNLGLALCRRIALRHGGDLTLQSESGVGTTISITLPLADEA